MGDAVVKDQEEYLPPVLKKGFSMHLKKQGLFGERQYSSVLELPPSLGTSSDACNALNTALGIFFSREASSEERCALQELERADERTPLLAMYRS